MPQVFQLQYISLVVSQWWALVEISCVYRCEVVIGLVGCSCGLQEEPVTLMHLSLSDLVKVLKLCSTFL